METEAQKFIDLNKKADDLKTKKIRIEEQYKSKESELRRLILEIKNAGYEPKNLKKVIEEKSEEINKKIKEFESQLNDLSKKLFTIEEG